MLISKFGTAKKEDIFAVCPKMPLEMVSFLEKYNGGETPETTFSIGKVKSDIVAFYGVGNVKYSYSGVQTIEFGGQCFLPIAFDSFGNQIVISLDNGNICFADHEMRQTPIILAKSLRIFLNEVNSKPIDPKHLKSVEDREKDLVSRGKAANISDALRELWQKEIDKYASMHQETVEI